MFVGFLKITKIRKKKKKMVDQNWKNSNFFDETPDNPKQHINCFLDNYSYIYPKALICKLQDFLWGAAEFF